MDQGAFNQYYEKEVKGKPMDKVGVGGGRGASAAPRMPQLQRNLRTLRRLPQQLSCVYRCSHLRTAPQAFNTKMYHPFRPATRIVHLHG